MSEKKRKGKSPQEILRRWDSAASKIRLRLSMSKSPAVREIYESLISEIGASTFEKRMEKWHQLLDLLEKEFGPLWPQSPNVN